MNLNDNPTPDQLRHLLRPCDDRAGHHLLWVGRDGEVHLDRIPRGVPPADFEAALADRVQFRFEAFRAGNEYVGPEAADDDDWIAEAFGWLVNRWPEVRGKAEVAYQDY